MNKTELEYNMVDSDRCPVKLVTKNGETIEGYVLFSESAGEVRDSEGTPNASAEVFVLTSKGEMNFYANELESFEVTGERKSSEWIEKVYDNMET